MQPVLYPKDIESRWPQIFPVLEHDQIDLIRSLGGPPRRFAPGELLTTGLAGIVWRDGATEVAKPIRHLFAFIGADPNTGWLRSCPIALDASGFVLTGQRPWARSFETSVPGVFAIGDVRSGSTKRVAAAVGEGAAVVGQLHALLAAS